MQEPASLASGHLAGLSAAHRASQAWVIDPDYDPCAIRPEPDVNLAGAPWVYGDAQLEAWQVCQLVREGFATNCHVHYEKNFGAVQSVMFFRCAWPQSVPKFIILRTSGTVTVQADAVILVQTQQVAERLELPLPDLASAPSWLVIEIHARNGEPAALLIEHGPFATGDSWQCSADGRSWTAARTHQQTITGQPPHRRQEPKVVRQPVGLSDDIYDFGVPLLGRPVLQCEGMPTISTGESAAEAVAPEAARESRMDPVHRSDNNWSSRYELGFRYLKVADVTPGNITAEASVHPVCYRGAFACSDQQLTRIWMHSALTLRSCMHHLMLDGVKRDRMPWVGDQASNLLANAYSFADSDIIRRSLTALGRPTGGYINGIVDYSLWWVINIAQYQLYFDDLAYVRSELRHVDTLLGNLAKPSDRDGLLRPDPKAWVFIPTTNPRR